MKCYNSGILTIVFLQFCEPHIIYSAGCAISPTQGSMDGGTLITITGEGFSAEEPEDNVITLGEFPCNVVMATSTQIVCGTGSSGTVHEVTNQGWDEGGCSFEMSC